MNASRTPRPRRSPGDASGHEGIVIRLDEPSEHRLPRRQPAEDDLGMRWAVAWYEGMQSYRRRMGHVAA